MADTSRKRSRKSKLVPRECSLYEDDLELQLPEAKIFRRTIEKPSVKQKPVKPPETTIIKPEPAVDTSVLKKINASAKKDDADPRKISPRKFEVNIEVESCDDEDDEFASIRVENSLTTADEIQTTKTRTKPITLTRDRILEAADNILETSTEKADKILNIYVRNTIGEEHQEKLNTDSHETKIQEALDDWRAWQSRSFHREDPLFYKCYICTSSWWLLSDFRNHMSSEHPNDEKVKIVLERYETHEANLIAYHERLVVIMDIYTEGLCHRCGKDYAAHELEGRIQERFYYNKGCSKQFFSCMGLRDHLPSCPVCNVEDKPFKCVICKSRFDTIDELTDHLVRSHSVRSDIPMNGHYNYCKKCSERYACRNLHKCLQKGPKSECSNCFRSFSNVDSMELHMQRSKKAYKCEVCNKVLKHGCSKYWHMLEHTDRYMIVRKCVKCDGLNVFLNTDDAAGHLELKHEIENTEQQVYFPKILVPSSCVYQSLVESEMQEEEESLVAELEGKELEPQVEQEERTTRFMMDDVVVKEEPLDLDDNQLVIKEEPIDVIENQIGEQMENIDHEIRVKEEIIGEEEDIDEYEDDLIKLNFEDLEELLGKRVSMDDETEYSQSSQSSQATSENRTEDDDSQEDFPRPMKEEEEDDEGSILEPQIILGKGKNKRKIYRCTKCGFTANHKQYRAHIEFYCTKNPLRHKTYVCTKCDKTFKSMKKYLAHFELHGYKHKCCPDCLQEFESYAALAQHVQLHIKQNFVRVKMITHAGRAMSKPDYQCKKCSETISLMNFFEHWESHINAQPTHPMKVTSRPPVKRGELHETIIKECIARLYKTPKDCNHCHRHFKRVNECKRHIIEHLLADAYNQKHILHELRCQICEAGFPIQEKYKQHMRDHASLPVYKCELCDRTFSDSSNFTKHKKVHNLKVIICDLCGKKFQSKLSLGKHIEKHKNTAPVTCELCNKVFYFESSYRRHIRYFHEKTTHGFRCINCGDRFDSLKQKWDHMWLVHKERKQKADCPICHESFRKFSDVRAHARATHFMEVSVLSVKRASAPTTTVIRSTQPPKIKPGKKETLVIFDD